jgi:uncharacterized protein YifN (PemK superfamily)
MAGICGGVGVSEAPGDGAQARAEGKEDGNLAIKYHPKRGSIVTVDFSRGFVPPEMVKNRLCVVVSPPISERVGLCTVVPLSKSPPLKPMPYHCALDIAFELPDYWGKCTRWVKGDMIASVSFERVDLLRLGKDANGKRLYQTQILPKPDLDRVINCILRSLGIQS